MMRTTISVQQYYEPTQLNVTRDDMQLHQHIHSSFVGICYGVHIDNSTDQVLEVPPHHTLCFQCQFKEDSAGNEDISWKIGGLVFESGT